MTDPYKTSNSPGASPSAEPPDAAQPEHIGRYRVEKILGEGGFGLVYLAQDEQLQRRVAIKVPHAGLVVQSAQAEAYLTEARTVANLDHPHIVPVFDVGSTEHFPYYVVSKFVDGTDLATRLKHSRLSIHEAVELVATVAEALHFAHTQGLVHRDIKPGNLLLDRNGKPFVADFGLALRENDVGKGPRYAGSPAYMSPEQARGEGHRVDGRSDIFSLGVVFYELLTGRHPFKAGSEDELLKQITSFEPRPPRQYDDSIPKELERICFKALSKRASERYLTASDFADDLRYFLAEHPSDARSASNVATTSLNATTPVVQPSSTTVGTGASVTPKMSTSDSRVIKIVPKGLRSFDAHDADFFLELLPGPRDRDGLPDSIRFWKTRIEETDADSTFTVGLIYGPSGCGKSSLMKAGLLPRLSGDVIAVYIEATAEETETRLLNGLRKRCPALSDNLSLKESLAALRRGQGLPSGKKLFIVLDQFEQWLHAKGDEPDTELIQALRQCDGGRVQCIVMVRDDFWMAVTRFLTGLEIELLQGRNCAAADLFDLDHARKVLAALGRAFGKFPEHNSEITRDQTEFLNQVVSGLAQDGKVICVRLALFAEMMKGKTWTPATLKEVGGTEGIGVAFLEETFSSPSANPKHRMYQHAAQGVLKALLPDRGTDIRGHMRSISVLKEASGHADQPSHFEALVRILDSEIRLITPTDPEGKVGAESGSAESGSTVNGSEKYYQLTHDYLVPSLRDWLTRKQTETRRGRAELLLADRAAVWNARPENRQLPSLWEWFHIRGLTTTANWTPQQRKMMRKAFQYHATRGLIVVIILTLLGWSSYEFQGKLKAVALRDRLHDAKTNEVPTIVQNMVPYRRWLDPLLRDAMIAAKTTQDVGQQLHTSLALLPVDATQVDYLVNRLLDAAPHEVPVIREALAPYKDSLRSKLWEVAEKPGKGPVSRRLRAAAALAKYDSESERWSKCNALVVNDVVLQNSVFLGQWSEALRPVKNRLLPPLSAIFRDHQPERTAERALATNLLADYAADQPNVLAELIMDADDKQFGFIYPLFEKQLEHGRPLLIDAINRTLPSDAREDVKEQLAKRQANAAVALLKMSQPEKVWPLLQHSPDPRVRSYLIHRIVSLGANPQTIIEQLETEPDITIRRALLLSLGEFGDENLSYESRGDLIVKIQKMYRDDDPGLHAAAEWLLRQWKQGAWLNQVNDERAKDKEDREQRLAAIRQTLATSTGKTPQWYVNGQGQTLVVIPGPSKFLMGSSKSQLEQDNDETQHEETIDHSFAIATKPVTVDQYRRFDKTYERPEKYTRLPDLPVAGTSWFQAAEYCNWLSQEEGLPESQWIYEIAGDETKVKANYLTLTGYRLPTEAEVEYATRAGAATSRYYGETDELLTKYAWFLKTSRDQPWPVGSLKPNDWGLFDVQGNVWTWCQEAYIEHRAETAPASHEVELVKTNMSRVLRGGSYNFSASNMRSANRGNLMPMDHNNYFGFRVARTF